MDIRSGRIILESTQDKSQAAMRIDSRDQIMNRRIVHELATKPGGVALNASDSVGFIDGLAAEVASGMSKSASETKKASLDTLKRLAHIGLAVSRQAETTDDLVRQAIDRLQPIEAELPTDTDSGQAAPDAPETQ